MEAANLPRSIADREVLRGAGSLEIGGEDQPEWNG